MSQKKIRDRGKKVKVYYIGKNADQDEFYLMEPFGDKKRKRWQFGEVYIELGKRSPDSAFDQRTDFSVWDFVPDDFNRLAHDFSKQEIKELCRCMELFFSIEKFLEGEKISEDSGKTSLFKHCLESVIYPGLFARIKWIVCDSRCKKFIQEREGYLAE